MLQHTVVRYWGPITGPYSDNSGLELAVPPAQARPQIAWQEAARPCNRSTGTNNCATETIPEDVFLAVGTDTNSFQIEPGGAMIPTMDKTLVYVIAEASCVSSGAPTGPGPTSTTTPRVYSCVSFDFVDANTGRGLGGMDSNQLRLPPHA